MAEQRFIMDEGIDIMRLLAYELGGVFAGIAAHNFFQMPTPAAAVTLMNSIKFQKIKNYQKLSEKRLSTS